MEDKENLIVNNDPTFFDELYHLMKSGDYLDRLRAEYMALTYRCEKLAILLIEHKYGLQNIVLGCPVKMLEDQYKYMVAYRKILIERAKYEGVVL